MFPFPSYLEMEMETCFRFHLSLKWKQKRVSVSIYDKFTLNYGNGHTFPFPVCHLFVINLLTIYGACTIFWYFGPRWNHNPSQCFIPTHFPIHLHPPLPPPLPMSNSLQLPSAHNISAPIFLCFPPPPLLPIPAK